MPVAYNPKTQSSMEERIMMEAEKYKEVFLKYSYRGSHQYVLEEPEKRGRWRELAQLRLFPLGE